MRTKHNIFSRKRTWAGILLAQVVLFYFLSGSEWVVQAADSFFDWRKHTHQSLFASFPFAAGDVLYIMLLLALLYLFIQIIRNKKRHWHSMMLLILANGFYLVYQIFWGMLYFQKPLSEKMPQSEISPEFVQELTLQYLEECRILRAQAEEDENGVFRIKDHKQMTLELLRSQHTAALMSGKHTTGINALKPSLFHGVMSYSGILGYYNPFTAEAQYNPDLPHTSLPITMAHEAAHQLGYAREQEASFIGFLNGKASADPALQYSASYYALKSLLNSQISTHPRFVKQVLELYSEGMKRDRRAELEFRKKHSGWLDVFFTFTNDLFLKSNQQEGSVTYSYFVELLLQYELSARTE